MKETTRDRAIRIKSLRTDLVSGLQAAEIKDVSPKAVYEAIKSGRLPAVKLGMTHLINRRDLEAWKIVGHRIKKKDRRVWNPPEVAPKPEETDE